MTINFAEELNDQQFSAVTSTSQHNLVLAGAGSGKTRTIIYRVAYLLSQNVQPENILLVTFTNKAAREMTERVNHLLNNDQSFSKVWSGTFHSIAHRLLKKYGSAIDIKNNFTIIDEEDCRDLIALAIKECGVIAQPKIFPTPAVIRDLYSFSRNTVQPLEDIILERHPSWEKYVDDLKQITQKFQEKKEASSVLDFDDLLYGWLKLLNHPNIKTILQNQFKHVLVDEYQDTNKIQASIILALANTDTNIVAVGDDAQSIYSFRGADISNIISFPKNFTNCQTFRLEKNYRSTPEILTLANHIISGNKNQFQKTLQAVLPSASKPLLFVATDSRHEADFICKKINQVYQEGTSLNDIAVLFRASFHSQQLELALNKLGIEYEYRGGVRFFERSHIKDTLAFLRVINNINDEMAWRRILLLQPGIGDRSAEQIFRVIQTYTDINFALNDGQISNIAGRGRDGWKNLVSLFEELKVAGEINPVTAPGIILSGLPSTRYKQLLEVSFPDWQERLEDIKQLAVFAEQFPTIHDFIAELTLQTERFNLKDHNSNNGKIILSTIHQAKGLEWQQVFIINVCEGSFPHYKTLGYVTATEEERRLFYVAVTRAKQELVISYPSINMTNGSWTVAQASPFIREIPDNLFASSYDSISLPASDGEISYLPDLSL